MKLKEQRDLVPKNKRSLARKFKVNVSEQLVKHGNVIKYYWLALKSLYDLCK